MAFNNGANVYNVPSASLTSYAAASASTLNSSTSEDGLDSSLPPTIPKAVNEQATNSKLNAREKKILGSVRNILVTVALSVHGIFEGMAIGGCG